MKENRRFGTGWWSGHLSLFFSVLCLAAILCFSLPAIFTTPGFRSHYPIPLLIGLTRICLFAAYVLGIVGIVLKRKNFPSILGLCLALAGQIYLRFFNVLRFQEVGEGRGLLGLDWFVLNILMLAVLFVPIERWKPLHAHQKILRPAWKMDVVYFAVSHIFVQFTVYMSILPAKILFSEWRGMSFLDVVPTLPFVLQFVLIMIVADFSEYWIHRAFHQFPKLWNFHAVHHGIREMDWLASSRLHIIDILVVRSLTFIPIFALNFSEKATLAYLSFVSVHAVFIHSNFRIQHEWIEKFLVFPRFHHWHHALEKEAIDKNFALHFPLFDKLFGTYLLPKEKWPKGYGIAAGDIPPETGFLDQLKWTAKKSVE